MPTTNSDIVIKSWPFSSTFQTGILEDKEHLVADKFRSSRSLYMREHKETQLASTFDFGSDAFEVEIPQSYGVVSSCYLVVELPALNGANYKSNPGLHFLKDCELHCDSERVYRVPVYEALCDYLGSLTDEEAKQFLRNQMGRQSSPNGNPRTLMIPLFLPNSHFLRRQKRNSGQGYGIFPNRLNSTSKSYFRLTVNPSNYLTAAGVDGPATVQNQCKLLCTILRSTGSVQKRFENGSGVYSIMTPTFYIEKGWTNVDQDTDTSVDVLPQGCVTDLIVMIRPRSNPEDMEESSSYNPIVKLGLTCDSEKVIDLPSKSIIDLQRSQQAERDNSFIRNEAKLCFSTTVHGDKVFQGCMHFRAVSKCSIDFTVNADSQYQIVSKRLAKVYITSSGKVKMSNE